VRRSRSVISVALALIALALLLATCAGDDDEEATTYTAPAEAPSERATPQNSPGALPPKFINCMAEQGFEVDPSGADLHSAPPEVLQACFGALHQGGR
jgi:hypothetical protein